MQWTRSETLALASERCVFCQGAGLKPTYGGRLAPCNCVFRAIFRLCLERFKRCTAREKFRSNVTEEIYGSSGSRRTVWGRKDEEYMADFCLIAKRSLTPEEHRIFTVHFLLGAEWPLACQRLKLEKGEFFHHVYRIMQKLGREFREVSPYPLYPLDEYFGGTMRGPVRSQDVRPLPVNHITGLQVVPLRAPLRKPDRPDQRLPKAA